MKKVHFTRRRILSILLAAALAVGCLPFMTGGEASAESLPQPNYSGSFKVYSTYFNYSPFTLTGNNYGWMTGDPAKLYMEYSTDGKNWMRSGYMKYNYITTGGGSYRIGGLKPNTWYKTRIWYGDEYGNRISPIRSTATIKTGRNTKLAIKSVTCKAVNVRYHRHRVAGHYVWTGYHLVWIGSYTEKYYTYKVKVTVKLKKAPGTGGIFVNGRFLKGNKKQYTTTFSPYPNYSSRHPRGRIRYTVSVCSGQNKNWGGYSPAWKGTRKLK